MNEQNMLEKIRQSAQDIKVPDSLRPEQMQKHIIDTFSAGLPQNNT